MTTDEKKNEERQVSRRQLIKTGVGLIGAARRRARSILDEAVDPGKKTPETSDRRH